MKTWMLCSLIAASTLIAGCDRTVRPISHSAYSESSRNHSGTPPGANPSAFAYRGELSEFDVLGITRGAAASDADIEEALRSAKRVKLRPGNSVLLIQSGAIFPDGPMVKELSKQFRVVPFSGVPPESRRMEEGAFERSGTEGFARSLRLTAARGGNDVILCYWGILESENSKLATKTVSWVPVVNWIVPDERQHMRIRLKMALIDVRSGDWAVLSPEPVDDRRISWSPRRGAADQKLVEDLKEKAYTAGAQELLRQYAESTALK